MWKRALPEARCSLAYPVCLNIEPNPTLKAKQTNRSMCEACLPILALLLKRHDPRDGWVEGRTRHALV